MWYAKQLDSIFKQFRNIFLNFGKTYNFNIFGKNENIWEYSIYVTSLWNFLGRMELAEAKYPKV